MTTAKQWLLYWKKCLSDASKADINIAKLPSIEIPDFKIESEYIVDLAKVNQLLDKAENRKNHKNGITSKSGDDWVSVDEVDVLVAPFWLTPRTDHKIRSINPTPKYPFWFYAKINRQGKWRIPDEPFPVFQRKYLEPLADDEGFVFSSMEKVDSAAAFTRSEFTSYTEYLDFVLDIFWKVSDQKFNQYQVEGFERVSNSLLVVPDEEISAAISIIRLYEKILLLTTLPHLLHSLIQPKATTPSPSLTVPEFEAVNPLHVGQMGFEFALSISQRKALYTILRADAEQTIFAVNGPPGTGKTTLLQSVVANAYVQAALQGLEAPLILACSTNNQAVTNIIDSFSKSLTNAGTLQGRWLPEIEGYATYLPSSSKPQSELTNINYKKLDGDGLFQRIENSDFLLHAKKYFQLMSEKHFEAKSISIQETIELLRKEIRNIEHSLKDASQRWGNYVRAEKEFQTSYLGYRNEKERYCRADMIDETELIKDIQSLKNLEGHVIRYFKNEPFLRKIGCFFTIKASLENRAAELRIIFRDSLLQKPSRFKYSEILNTINGQIHLATEVIHTLKNWRHWKDRSNIVGNPPRTEEEYWKNEMKKIREGTLPCRFYDELDQTLRHRAFQLALHYWEGRYLMKLSDDLSSDIFKGKNEAKSINRWKRQAMLTPCFVSTFFMAPKFFSWSKYLGDNDKGEPIFDNVPLFEIADLLIVDEAGQTSPEVGIATFALAKKAIVVGDTKQIEPVWNVTNKIDIGNMWQSGLINDYNDSRLDTEFNPKGFLSSTGSIMKIAQNACEVQEPSLKEKGLLLVEHRRCYDEIINYCNELAYGQLLKPQRGLAEEAQLLFPPMFGIHVNGNSAQSGTGSRYNLAEVNAIVDWLKANKARIEGKYGKLEASVGIITPFVGQKTSLRFALKNAGFDTNKMKIGTVHALQGAERSIVLFSMVYGPGDSGTLFFDRDNKPNMLNVAVSRAKDNFVVFCNSGILNKSDATPSGILARHLQFDSSTIP